MGNANLNPWTQAKVNTKNPNRGPLLIIEGEKDLFGDGRITLVPLPFAFTGRPIFIIITYTIVGSLFIPFLAATLLYLNNRVAWTEPVPRNHWTTNLLLVAILGLFAMVGAQEVIGALR